MAADENSKPPAENCDMSCRELRKMYDRCKDMVGNCTHYGATGYENASSNTRDNSGKSQQSAATQTQTTTTGTGATAAAALAVNPSGFTTPQEQIIQTSITDHHDALIRMRTSLSRWDANDQADFQLAFGATDAAAKAHVSDMVEKQIIFNQSLTVSNFVLATTANAPQGINLAQTYAWVTASDTTKIYLADLYWTAPATGVDSRAGVLIHEISHFTVMGGTKDYFPTYLNGASIYGRTASQALAVANSTLALKHADSFEYWGETR